MWRKFIQSWKQYRYRLVPWISLNLKQRSPRQVLKGEQDKVLSDSQVGQTLVKLFSALQVAQVQHDKSASQGSPGAPFTPLQLVQHDNSASQSSPSAPFTPPQVQHDKSASQGSPGAPFTSPRVQHDKSSSQGLPSTPFTPRPGRQQSTEKHKGHLRAQPHLSSVMLHAMHQCLGFTIERAPSSIPGAGRGVFVSKGTVPSGAAVAMYSGALYQPWEPLLLQSLGNPFIFRCIDGLHIDGNHRGISKLVYKSCAHRDRVGPYMVCDMSWLTEHVNNPLAIGQYVNNQSKSHPANVVYQEYNIPRDFPFEFRKFIPNVYYSPSMDNSSSERLVRTVVLVSTRQIDEGEEIFSTYFTLLH